MPKILIMELELWVLSLTCMRPLKISQNILVAKPERYRLNKWVKLAGLVGLKVCGQRYKEANTS